MADGRFEFDASAYDAVYPSIHDWAHAKKIEDTHSQEVVEPPREYQSSAKQPTIPFTPLTREIGISPVDDTETREMTRSYQQQISMRTSSRDVF